MLATAATVIASQATISGAFSMARQAVQLDLLPRLRVLQTSALEQGQIYVPVVNWLVFIAVIAFVVGFGSSDALGGRLRRGGGRHHGRHHHARAPSSRRPSGAGRSGRWRRVFGLLMIVDLAFVARQHDQGADAAAGFRSRWRRSCASIFMTWRSGRLELRAALRARWRCRAPTCRSCVAGVHRVPGTGVFLASDADLVPSALIRNIEHNGVVHERVDHPQRGDRAHAAPGSGAARRDRGDAAGRVPASPRASASWRRRTSARRSRPAGRAGCACSPRTARSSSAGTWCAPGRCRAARAAAAAVRAHAAAQHAGGGVLPHALPRCGDPQHRRWRSEAAHGHAAAAHPRLADRRDGAERRHRPRQRAALAAAGRPQALQGR